jgi:hypothetical protein
MADAASSHARQPQGATGVLVLADGTCLWGHGFGASGSAVGWRGGAGSRLSRLGYVAMGGAGGRNGG